MVFCSKCGTQIPSGGVFCPKCGTKCGVSENRSKSPPPKTKTPMATTTPINRAKSPTPSSRTYDNNPSPINLNRTTPNVKSITTGNAQGAKSTTYYDMETNNPGVVKPGLPPPTYEKQPAWAYAERHKNANLQYKDGQFRHLNI